MRSVLKRYLSILGREFYSRFSSLRNDSVLFLTYQGDYTCNPKAIAEALIARKQPLKLYWAVKKGYRSEEYPPELILVRRGTPEFYKAAACSKVIVDNAHNFIRLRIRKRPGQYLLQTWHGSLGIKRLDGAVVTGSDWTKRAKTSQKITDYLISNSDFETKVFHTSYWKGVSVLSFGHARNDILLSDWAVIPNEISERVHTRLNIPLSTSIALYAPTHRDNNKDLTGVMLDYSDIAAALKKRFHGRWVIVVRFHNRLKNELSMQNVSFPVDCVVDATNYPDIQDLLIASAVGITDYSSWIFDYLLLRRPAFLLTTSLESFEEQRSFYFPLSDTPFPISHNVSELAYNITDFNEESYRTKLESFLRLQGCIEDGRASIRIADKILELLSS